MVLVSFDKAVGAGVHVKQDDGITPASPAPLIPSGLSGAGDIEAHRRMLAPNSPDVGRRKVAAPWHVAKSAPEEHLGTRFSPKPL
jgi:hypothetical protein